MTGARHSLAVSAALELSRSPSLVHIMRDRELPNDIVEVLQIFARDPDAIERARAWISADVSYLLASVDSYVQLIMCHENAPPHRVLGVRPEWGRDVARLHMKLLMSGFHPDVADDPWRAGFARRVLSAWSDYNRGGEFPVARRRRRRRPLVLPWIAAPAPAAGQSAIARPWWDAVRGAFAKIFSSRAKSAVGRSELH